MGKRQSIAVTHALIFLGHTGLWVFLASLRDCFAMGRSSTCDGLPRGLGFIESAFAPVPLPDVMLIPMTLKHPSIWISLALKTTIFLALSGLFGYLIGFFAFEPLEPIILEMGYWEKFQKVLEWFNKWGFGVVFIASFPLLTYKLFTIATDSLKLSLVPFLLALLVGRRVGYFLIAWLGHSCVISFSYYAGPRRLNVST